MRVFAVVSATVLILGAACGARDVQPDHQAEWRNVLQTKPAGGPSADAASQRQVYADSVHAFVQKHPNHDRAQEVWRALQLEFADDLASSGRHQDAIRYYRSVLSTDPENERARRGLAIAADRIAVTRQKLETLHKGMSQQQVAGVLGHPIPGWSRQNRRPEALFEAWYYRTTAGGVAAVYFRDGKVFAAEESSHARIGRLGS